MGDESREDELATTLLEYLHRCPVCGHPEVRAYCRVPSLFEADRYLCYERCNRCDVVFQNPRLPAAERERRYREKPRETGGLELDDKSQVHYAQMLKRIVSLVPSAKGERLLDFGCGTGGFLVEARAAGFDGMGLELGEDLARHVEEVHRFPVHSGLISDPVFRDEKFGVIVSSQVFEHLLDPLQALRDLREHLVAPAVLLIEVPNLRDTRERVQRGKTMDDSHLFYFSKKSLGLMLEAEGFEVLAVEEGVRPWRFLGRNQLDRVPENVLSGAERVLSRVGLRTGLSIVAVRKDAPAN